MNKFCKILISYHQPAPLLNDDIFIPIQTGRSEYIKDYQENKIPEQEYKWMMDNTTGDDTGENISQLGSNYVNSQLFIGHGKITINLVIPIISDLCIIADILFLKI